MKKPEETRKREKGFKSQRHKQPDHKHSELYLRPDAVASSISKKLGVKKRQIVGEKNAAVRVALAESHQVRSRSESKNKNKSEESSVPKPLPNQSAVKLLVRNVPFQANESELLKLFSAYGEVDRLTLPKKIRSQHRGFCFVQYLSEEDATRAFTSLYRSTHLYGRRLVIEWANETEPLEEMRARRTKKFGFRPSEKPANTRSLKSAINSEISAKKRGEDVDQDIMDGSYSGW